MGLLARLFALAGVMVLLSSSPTLARRGIRKSLNFNVPLEADFYTESLTILGSHDPYFFFVFMFSYDPYQTARDFLRHLAYPDGSYFIRKDSYTDENTGISHIYVRQIVNGLEVADGNINFNIRDGQVLSYGDSASCIWVIVHNQSNTDSHIIQFFKGSVESSLLSVPNWQQGVYCYQISTDIRDHACGRTLDRLQKLASSRKFDLATSRHDPRAAAFFFMQTAHPEPVSLASTFTLLEAKLHKCTDPPEEEMSCEEWLVTGLSDQSEPIHARQVYVQTPGAGGSIHLNMAWRLEVPMADNHYEAYASVNDPSKIISVTDWVVEAPIPDSNGRLGALQQYVFAQLQGVLAQDLLPAHSNPDLTTDASLPIASTGSYRVWKWGINDPESGERTLEKAPADRRASPLGWHSVPAGNDPVATHPDLDRSTVINYTTTVGNNVIAQENWDGGEDWKTNIRPDGGPGLVFDFPYGADPSEPGWEKIEPRQYVNLSVTQLFYTANMYHDLLYLYGFDEASGNFQQHNFGKGAAEDDAIIIKAQDSSGFNNIHCMTPPDGQNGLCRVYVSNVVKPFRDIGLDAGILIHELSHGLSIRLTGGPRNSNCLSTREAGGMGEGWGDFIATTVRSTNAYQDYPIGAWPTASKSGFRHFPYSTNISTNPSLYDRLQRLDYQTVYMIGEVWAEMLWVVSNELIKKHGFADSLFPSSDSNFYRSVTLEDNRLSQVPKYGNALMLQLIVNGMKTQPCNPTFVQARDAIIAADKELTGGENKCTLWKAFASRGLGTNAKNVVFRNLRNINGFEVPPECK